MAHPMSVRDFVSEIHNAMWFTGAKIFYTQHSSEPVIGIKFRCNHGSDRIWYLNGEYTAIQLVYLARHFMYMWTAMDYELGPKLGLTMYDTKSIVGAIGGTIGKGYSEIRTLFLTYKMPPLMNYVIG